MLQTGINRLTGIDDPCRAWRCFIHDDDIVALNFTRLGSRELGTNTGFCEALLECLYRAGFNPEQFLIVGVDTLPPNAEGTIPFVYGWRDETVDAGITSVTLARWVDDVTAIINVPSILDDNITGLRGCLLNLSWPVIKSPARLYLNHGDPFIPEIYRLPQISGKVRLHIANALRILYHGGPDVNQRYIYEHGCAIFSLDPVALDRVALELIRRSRRTMPMPPNTSEELHTPWLDTAFAMGLGYNDLNFIRYRFLKHNVYRD